MASQDDIDKITARIRDFDGTALLALLRELGYTGEAVLYQALDKRSPQPTLFDSIAFEHGGALAGAGAAMFTMLGVTDAQPTLKAVEAAIPTVLERAAEARGGMSLSDLDRMERGTREDVKVTVTANLGLVSCRSPLPSYFDALLHDPAWVDYQAPLLALLDILDNSLIQNRLESFRPELVPAYLPGRSTTQSDGGDATQPDGWGQMKRDWLRLTAVATPCTLHWMFEQIFPELEVSVRRAPIPQEMRAPSVRLCDPRAPVGRAAFGGRANVTVYGLEVTLIADEALTGDGVPWLVEITRRVCEQAFPILAEVGVSLTILLLSRERPASLELDDAAHDDRTRLGVNPLEEHAGDPPLGGPPWRAVVWSGVVPREGRGCAWCMSVDFPDRGGETAPGPSAGAPGGAGS